MAEGARAGQRQGGQTGGAAAPRLRYAPATGRHDEAFGPDGRPRAHWAPLVRWIADAGPRGVEAAARELARLRDESGIAFTSRAPAAGDGADPMPVLVSPADWAALEAGLAQRARLAEAAIADIYGPRVALREGIIPPGLVFGSDAFAAHAAGWDTPPARHAVVYEADIARGADGRWMVLADRLDAPLGDGWLIANRIATSQALAEPFVDLGVRRIASHLARFQDLLDSLTGWEGRLALLTGGERDPRFFSHAYLARYLNATLVEAADLTVREGAVFVKTLDGLKKVDVLLRGVPDRLVDALHRPASAAVGAPALTVAARAGGLVMGNAIGTAVMAWRALAPYAHVLCERLLGEPLLIADAPCLWLGDPQAREQVLDELPFWRIEPLTGGASPDQPPALGGNPAAPVSADVLDRFARDLERRGERFAAVATPPLATTPVWVQGGLAPREWMMRAFASRTAEGWSVAPAGVAATVAPGCPPPALGFGKDVWVLPDPDAP
ncbi:MAG: circularly permuted type 2 ATP-grasp protein, partial [Thermohalobaculum sp.]|nr:circularly permuted type 2 ATP-grasp protein [Thermohalobaculum sp.]